LTGSESAVEGFFAYDLTELLTIPLIAVNQVKKNQKACTASRRLNPIG